MAEKNIGYVVELSGAAQVKTVEGIIKVLSVGDKIHEGDLLTTGPNAEILIEFYNGEKLQVSENAEVLLDESVYASLDNFSDDRADQLAELQQLIVDTRATLFDVDGSNLNDENFLDDDNLFAVDSNDGSQPGNTPTSTPSPTSTSPANPVPAPGTSDTTTPTDPIASITVNSITVDGYCQYCRK